MSIVSSFHSSPSEPTGTVNLCNRDIVCVLQVVHELLALELLTVLLEDPTSDSVEVAVGFLKECGQKLTDLSPRGILG